MWPAPALGSDGQQRTGPGDRPLGELLGGHRVETELEHLVLGVVDGLELLVLDVLHLAARLANDPVSRIERVVGLANVAVLGGDQGHDAAALGGLVGRGHPGLDPPSGLHVGVHELPLLPSGAVSHGAIDDDGVVAAVEHLHTAPLRGDEGRDLVTALGHRDRDQSRVLQLWPGEDAGGARLVEHHLGDIVIAHGYLRFSSLLRLSVEHCVLAR